MHRRVEHLGADHYGCALPRLWLARKLITHEDSDRERAGKLLWEVRKTLADQDGLVAKSMWNEIDELLDLADNATR